MSEIELPPVAMATTTDEIVGSLQQADRFPTGEILVAGVLGPISALGSDGIAVLRIRALEPFDADIYVGDEFRVDFLGQPAIHSGGVVIPTRQSSSSAVDSRVISMTNDGTFQPTFESGSYTYRAAVTAGDGRVFLGGADTAARRAG